MPTQGSATRFSATRRDVRLRPWNFYGVLKSKDCLDADPTASCRAVLNPKEFSLRVAQLVSLQWIP